MSLKNCADCGKLFAQERLEQVRCKECSNLDEQDFRNFREQLRQNRSLTLQELSIKTGFPMSKIMSWVREGRIHFS